MAGVREPGLAGPLPVRRSGAAVRVPLSARAATRKPSSRSRSCWEWSASHWRHCARRTLPGRELRAPDPDQPGAYSGRTRRAGCGRCSTGDGHACGQRRRAAPATRGRAGDHQPRRLPAVRARAPHRGRARRWRSGREWRAWRPASRPGWLERDRPAPACPGVGRDPLYAGAAPELHSASGPAVAAAAPAGRRPRRARTCPASRGSRRAGGEEQRVVGPAAQFTRRAPPRRATPARDRRAAGRRGGCGRRSRRHRRGRVGPPPPPSPAAPRGAAPRSRCRRAAGRARRG